MQKDIPFSSERPVSDENVPVFFDFPLRCPLGLAAPLSEGINIAYLSFMLKELVVAE